MSDSGILANVQSEIVTALTTQPIIVGMPVLPAMSLEDLINKQSLSTPAIGIIYLGSTKAVQYSIGSRHFRVTTKWRIAISSKNLRGTQDARSDVYSILEKVRDQLHFYKSAQAPKCAFLFIEEFCPDQFPEGKIVAYADFSLDLILGN